jgi:integrase
MSVYRRGGSWWYEFIFAGQRIRESTKSDSKTTAKQAEKNRRKELEDGFNGITREDRNRRVRTLSEAAEQFIADYAPRHRPKSVIYMKGCLAHLTASMGDMMLVEITADTVKAYQKARLEGKAASKCVNEETMVLLRLMEEQGDVLRARLRREGALRLAYTPEKGKALSVEEVHKLFEAARVPEYAEDEKHDLKATRTPMVLPAISLALNGTLRRGEVENLTWAQLDFLRRIVTVGRAKTAAGTGRTIPMNPDLRADLEEYRKWYESRIGPAKPEFYVFPFGKSRKWDPTRPVTELKSCWEGVRNRAGVKARFHDLRHTAITNLLESGAPGQTVMAIAGHVSQAMLRHYAHIRMESKRDAVAGLAVRRESQKAAVGAGF